MAQAHHALRYVNFAKHRNWHGHLPRHPATINQQEYGYYHLDRDHHQFLYIPENNDAIH